MLAEDQNIKQPRSAATPRALSNKISPSPRMRRDSAKRADSITSSGSLTSAQMEKYMKIEEDPEYRDVKFSEIMHFYKPQWLAYAGFTASVFASLSLPLFGFVLSKYIFVLSDYSNTAVPVSVTAQERDKWTWVFAALCIGIGSMAYL